MNLLFRADSSSQIGIGHIMRDLVLAQRYPEATITFACQDLSGHIMDKIPYPVHILKSNDPKELIERINAQKIEMVIFDHYSIDVAFEKQIKKATGVIIMSLDDMYQQHHCDILLNHNIYADKNRYKGLVPNYCKIQCGSQFTLIRDEFKEEKKNQRKKKKKKTSLKIFLAMGGTDTKNLNPKILKVLEKFDNIHVTVVTTTANKNLQELQQYIENKHWITLHIDTDTIAKLLRKSHFAVVTPSVMLNEVYFMQKPFIAIQAAPNQQEMVTYLKRNNVTVLKKFNRKKFYQHVMAFRSKN